ncbi:hypothetical protein [Nocardioides sp. LHG3406-4]|uniref:hypothetical protein n=1 Tax=Nocardioides sp. LHG3406-4 TaxID=2804575 RepID=UPI003CEB22CD
MLAGILTVLAGTAMLAAVLGSVLYASSILRVLVRLGRALGIVAEPRPTPGPPIDVISTDLRRLRAAVLHPWPGEPRVRRVATTAAYDDALRDACAALGIPDTLSQLPPGTDREAERLRVEWLLHEHGLDVA